MKVGLSRTRAGASPGPVVLAEVVHMLEPVAAAVGDWGLEEPPRALAGTTQTTCPAGREMEHVGWILFVQPRQGQTARERHQIMAMSV